MAPTPPPFARARSVSSKIRFFSSAVKMRRCTLAGTSTSAELVTKGTAILASLTMVLLAALLRNYPRGKCLIDIGTEGNYISRIRRERAHPPFLQKRQRLTLRVPAEQAPAATEDPLANAMRALSKPRYDIRQAMCNGDPTKKKLI